jgi:hypothetical protein
MPRFLVTYTDYTEDVPVVKHDIIGGIQIDDVESNLYRKTKCQSFEILNIEEMKGKFVNNIDA